MPIPEGPWLNVGSGPAGAAGGIHLHGVLAGEDRRARRGRGPKMTPAATIKQRIGQRVFPRLPITRFLFDQLRFELNGFRVRAANRTLPWRRARIADRRRQRDLLLNVACGPQILEGFVNLDLLPASPRVMAWDCRHRRGYDFETLTHRLNAAGFAEVRQMRHGVSLLPALARDRDVHAPYSLYVDAVKDA